MTKLPLLTSQQVIKLIERKGFILIEQKAAIIFTTTRKIKEELLYHFIKKTCLKELCMKF